MREMDQKLSGLRSEIYESQQQTRVIVDQILAMFGQQLGRFTELLQDSSWIGEIATRVSSSVFV